MTGLAIIPILPYLFDHPVEHATDTAFDWIRQKLIERNEAAKKGTDRKEL
jgi:fission process protein 1